MSRQNFLHLALVSLVPLLVAVALNSLEIEWAIYLWVFGIILMLVAIGGLQKTIGKDNSDPGFADEYQRARIDRARTHSLSFALFVLGGLMVALLFLPLLNLTGSDIPWPEVLRSAGMLAGVLMFGVSLTQLGTISLGMSADERADSTPATI
ncbi:MULTISPECIES: hypothetical protein [Corynebacterium]|uniref:hypothetical protein n=1 Tax=Corynebacterium TaxID=1716 RepID=UPI0008A4C92A|nr:MULTISPECIES: hypothetical protein [Corynebacterium]MBF9010235.1 hypothetical protein [Corynebacterium phoceense]OFL79876.1 hypothetical protein HMPREF2748_08940 [Corynebacterium sp. HMSC077B05]OFP17850.1 hypothetical protein HMPREF2998_02035 [Corynebacterium sp. HMSC065A05]OFP70772.1 hypothetical protein HMPREF2976_05340 [Corynebacterium sp. HMSC077D10]